MKIKEESEKDSLKHNTQKTKIMASGHLYAIYSWQIDAKTMETVTDFGGSDSKASIYNAGDPGSIPGLGSSPGEGNGNPLQYACWRIPWTEEPGRLQFMGSQESDTTEHTRMHTHTFF